MGYSDKHIFFDLDRTLWDFEANSERALRFLHEDTKVFHRIPSFEKFHKAYLKNNKRLWQMYSSGKMSKEQLRYERFRATLKDFKIADEIVTRQLGDGYVDLSPKQTALIPYAQRVLQDLSEMGFNLHIITNGFLEVQHVKLKYAGIHQHFKVILCSEEVGFNKPHPSIFAQALHQANAAAKNSLMVGDDYRADILGSIKAGMQAVWYQRDVSNKSKFENKINCLSNLPLVAAKLLG
jgi:putative hydrolase of the HAD superfamily